jgi:hypothetical protein
LDRITALVKIVLGMKERMRVGAIAPAHGRVVTETNPSLGGELRELIRIMSGVKELVRPMACRISDLEIVGQRAQPRSAHLGIASGVPGLVEEPANGLNRCGIER